MDHPVATGVVAGVVGGAAFAAAFPASAVSAGYSALPTIFTGATAVGAVGSSIVTEDSSIPIGTSFGKLGTVSKLNPISIKDIGGFTRHGINQIAGRGVKPEFIKQTLETPLLNLAQQGGKTLYLSQKAVIVLTRAKEIVTAYTYKEFNETIKSILNLIKNE